jgi:hypothetical protein
MIERYILARLAIKGLRKLIEKVEMQKQQNQLDQPLDAFNDAFYTWIEETENLPDRKLH